MKKIIILGALVLSYFQLQSFASCQLEKLENCKADINSAINKSIQDKIIPNNLDSLREPHNSFENRTQLGQPQLPENINIEPNQEDTQSYNANCQFGNCMNKQNTNGKPNNR